MCAQPNSTIPTVTTKVNTSVSTSATQKQDSSQGQMKLKNKSSRGGKRNFTPKQSGSAQKPNDQSRNAKRARWAKQNKPKQKPVVRRGPEKEYISACCSVPARKPRAGDKEAAKDPESGRMKDKVKGLGHWHCGQCGKPCKVTPRKPESKLTGSISTPTVFIPPVLETHIVAASFPVAPPGVAFRMVTLNGADMGRGTGVTNVEPKT